MRTSHLEARRAPGRAAPALLGLALLVSAVGCGDASVDDVGPATASAPATPSAIPGASIPGAGDSAFTAAARADDGGHGSGNGLGLTGVRTGQHPGFDRVVFELGGTGTPGWRAEYVADPRAEGSGDPVTLTGSVFLQVVLRGVGLPFDTGLAPFGDSTTRVPGAGTRGVAEIAPGGVFEGEQQAFIGLTGNTRPFRVFALTDPARVVVDVRNRAPGRSSSASSR